ncbi:Cellulase (glycosyl hydrolase family 5) [Verrucomicrobium sp. GAS474]|uniref:cellulase family glycosylhydrolase n=1 Tax=Verrucomicrobium sp. GAS474 TaxID=1882831 RepID=UPI00087D32B0|nr:cellulase family glycosylhydrolase [Verrucomicrobium sp. GAS474]SDU11785.1 Cellulase (glycosyl hydrolase family 5) [Verrucomicrobium sp. GAS474]
MTSSRSSLAARFASGLIIAAAWFPLSPLSARADAVITVVSPETSLIVEDKGSKTFHFHVDGMPTEASKAVVELRRFSSGPVSDKKIAAHAEVPLSGSDIEIALDVPEIGYYELTLRLESGSKQALASLVTSFAAVPTHAGANPSDFGVCTHFAQKKDDPQLFESTMKLVKLAGFSRIRDECYWDGWERQPGVFVPMQGCTDYIDAANRLGIAPLVVLDFGNGKAYPQLFTGKGEGHSSFPDTPEKVDLFTRYVEETVKLYNSKVKDWELWNEPQSWGKPSPAVYTALLKKVNAKIKEIDPDANVISCGGGGAGGGPGGDFITGILAAGGLNDQDGFSVHPYMAPYTPEFGYDAANSPIPSVSVPVVWKHLGKFVDNHPKANGKKLQFWVSEFGWVSSPINFFDGAQMQGAYVARAFLLSRSVGTCTAVFWYDFQNDGVDPRNNEHNFGLIRKDFSPKPAFVSMSVMSATVGSRPCTKVLVDDADAKVFAFGSEDSSGSGDVVYAGWSVASVGKGAKLKIPPGNYTRRDWDGHEQDVVVDEKGYNWTLRPFPQYLFAKKDAAPQG